MSLPRETMLELMAFADGELDDGERRRIEALLAESGEARLVVDAMRSPAIPAWLEDELAGRSVGADGIADAVMARVAQERPAREAAGGGNVVPIHRPRKGSRIQVVAGAVVAGLALAAGVTLYVSSVGTGSEPTKVPVASVGVPSVDVQPPPVSAAAAAQGPRQGVEVDEVDSPSRGFSVFEIPVGAPTGAVKGNGPSSVVIMIDDDPGAK